MSGLSDHDFFRVQKKAILGGIRGLTACVGRFSLHSGSSFCITFVMNMSDLGGPSRSSLFSSSNF